jgi:hypothetical protein
MLAEIFMLHLEAAARTRQDAIPAGSRFIASELATPVRLGNGRERLSVIQFRAKPSE